YWDSAHFYLDGPSTATMTEILGCSATCDSDFNSEARGIQSVQATYPQPWVINETSDVYSGGKDGVSDTYGAALYSLDFAFQAAYAGAYNINFISGGLGKINNNPYSVIQDSAGTAFYPTARYAGLYLFSLATQNRAANLVSTAISAAGVSATAYTVAHANGTFSTVIVNRSNTNLDISLSLPRDVQSANIITMANSTGSLTDQAQADVLIQGAPVQEAAPPAMGAPYTAAITGGAATVYVPAYSAALVQSTQSDVVGTTLTIHAPTITYGASATISVTVAANSGVPTGNVSLTVDGGTALSAPLSSGTATFTVSALAPGTHQLSASYAAQGSYAAGTSGATLTVSQASLTVTAADASRAYGAANPALTYIVAGFVNGDSGSVVTGVPAESTTAAATSAPGSYPITVAQGTLSAANYSFTFVNGSLTVAQASSSIALTATLAGNTATLTATATPQVSGVPGGAVTFMDGATALGSAMLQNGVATFTTGALPGGSNSLTAVYGGDTNFTGATSNAVVEVVNKTTPTITWSVPAAISYGTALSSAQLDATTSAAGSFVYTPAAGTVLGGGKHVLTATFTPANPSQYNTVKATVSLTVTKANPTIVWPSPASIVYGTPLSAVQLNASSPLPGSFTYSPVAGTLLAGGTHTLVVRFVPSDGTDYARVTSSVTIAVTPATPQITWANPAAITHGTRLSSAQLNAKANVPGRFVYSPPVGTILSTGTHTLNTTFTPSSTKNYNAVGASVSITVN
ncbi:MAG: Ig-like domain repeat protein, partial [Acidobacteriaceae bacterium]